MADDLVTFITEDEKVIDLTGRKAKCTYYPNGGKYHKCPEPIDSRKNLAFFEYRGEGSKYATEYCKVCGMYKRAHQKVNPYTGREGITDHEFVPKGPDEYDRYFCGCWGWD
jgi:hypothetical protein